MAPPTPLLLTLTTAGICMLKAIFLPELLPEVKLTASYLLIAAVVFGSWTVWKLFVYPNVQSPLRHLPQPKVCPARSLLSRSNEAKHRCFDRPASFLELDRRNWF